MSKNFWFYVMQTAIKQNRLLAFIFFFFS